MTTDRRPQPPEGFLEVGHVRRAHGLRGDVFVQLVTDRTERLDPGSVLWAGGRDLTVVERRTAPNGRHIVTFDALADRTAAEALANVALFAAPLPPADDSIGVHELIGRHVVDQHGIDRGRCVSVLDNPAAELLELDSGALVPSNFVVGLVDANGDVDHSGGRGSVLVDVPDGLFELDDTGS